MNLLEVDSVHLSYSGRKILSNVYLSCKKGEIVGILGRNGCGKSSLLKIIFGTLQAENQSVRIDKKYQKQWFKINEAFKYLPQDGFLMDYLTIRQVIKTFELADVTGVFTEERYENGFKTKIGNLSGGEKRWIEIMAMLYSKSHFVLLDEPFSYLSPVMVEDLKDRLESLKETKGIILTDHQYENVWEVADKRYIMYDGNLRALESRQELEDFGYLKTK